MLNKWRISVATDFWKKVNNNDFSYILLWLKERETQSEFSESISKTKKRIINFFIELDDLISLKIWKVQEKID